MLSKMVSSGRRWNEKSQTKKGSTKDTSTIALLLHQIYEANMVKDQHFLYLTYLLIVVFYILNVEISNTWIAYLLILYLKYTSICIYVHACMCVCERQREIPGFERDKLNKVRIFWDLAVSRAFHYLSKGNMIIKSRDLNF